MLYGSDRIRVRVTVKVTVTVTVTVAVRVTVRGGGLFPYTHACKAGLSGIWFNEGGRDLGFRN